MERAATDGLLQIRSQPGAGVSVLYVEGETDLSNRALLARELARTSGHVIVDMAGVRYLDVGAIGVLQEAAQECRRDGRSFILARLPRLIWRVFVIIEAAAAFEQAGSVEEALAMCTTNNVAPLGEIAGGQEEC